MPADELGTWFVRFVYIILGAFVIAALFTMLSPDLPEAELRAQALAARVAHDGGFWEGPGVIDPERFTQESADHAVQYGEPLMNIGLIATVTDTDGAIHHGPILYNRAAAIKLSRMSGYKNLTWKLPVTVDGELRQLQMEVWYAG